MISTDATSGHRHGIVLQTSKSSDLHKKISGEPKREIVIKRITVIDEAVFFSYLIRLYYGKCI